MSSSFLHLIIFDIDGTLLLSGPRVRALFSEAFQESFGRPAPLDGLSFAGHTDRQNTDLSIYSDILKEKASLMITTGALHVCT